MNDVLLIKKLNVRKFNKDAVIPVTFNFGIIEDRSVYVDIFNKLKSKGLVQTDRVVIKNDSMTIDVLSNDITEIIEELLKENQKIYGVYILYDNYLGGKNNE
ncbi:MAG: UDP-N-acetylmuramoyl-tripeptide--D-alanyl-D-alanine ligase [Peptoniphilaceae bacterium]|nr:UDP-N-acetylmuramoyl-tripeptide--D-alanyl-D-alanine ligase [Peptoniphilaceae bacterium]MDY6019452.1 UDP-N-acetylmuramoyl-tripeptide--D-alanyl-D-alanine ligase [Anaerococcus sp.]